MSNPKVSIIIPVFNGANFMREAIDSALSQTYKNIEVIVINDGSIDEGRTDKIAASYGNKILYYRKENGGVATALNLGLKKMSGEFFSWLSHDDVYYPNKIERQIKYIEDTENKDVILYSNYDYIDENSKFIYSEIINRNNTKKSLYAVLNHLIHGCTLLIPKKCFEEVGKFDESLVTTQDYDLWFKMARKYKLVHIPEILVKSRIHSERGSVKINRHSDENNELFIKFINELNINEILELESSERRFYLKMGLYLKEMQFNSASEYVMNKYRQNFDSINFIIFLEEYLYRLYYRSKNLRDKLKYASSLLKKLLIKKILLSI